MLKKCGGTKVGDEKRSMKQVDEWELYQNVCLMSETTHWKIDGWNLEPRLLLKAVG